MLIFSSWSEMPGRDHALAGANAGWRIHPQAGGSEAFHFPERPPPRKRTPPPRWPTVGTRGVSDWELANSLRTDAASEPTHRSLLQACPQAFLMRRSASAALRNHADFASTKTVFNGLSGFPCPAGDLWNPTPGEGTSSLPSTSRRGAPLPHELKIGAAPVPRSTPPCDPCHSGNQRLNGSTAFHFQHFSLRTGSMMGWENHHRSGQIPYEQ